MKAAYIDSSCLVAIEFAEPKGMALRRRIRGFEHLLSSNLLEAELRAAFAREGQAGDPATLSSVSWVLPDRPLSVEIQRVQAAGYLCGSDTWHLATALFVSPDPTALTFLTLDSRQREIARAIGFSV